MPDSREQEVEVAKIPEVASPVGKKPGVDEARVRAAHPSLLSDCRLMLRFALDGGRPLNAQLVQDITKVDGCLLTTGKEPLSELPVDLAERGSGMPRAGLLGTPVEEEPLSVTLLRVHGALSALITPATPQSLRATDPQLVWLGLPPLARFAIFGAMLSLAAFLVGVPKPELKKPAGKTEAGPNPGMSATPLPAKTPAPPPVKPAVPVNGN